MQEEERNKSSGMKANIQDKKKQKGFSFLEQRKGDSLLDEATKSMQQAKNERVHFASDAERNLDGERYRLGDMVWAKVKSHPWWPGQLYDPKLASASALELKRDSCFLVAFFGDSTFGWFAEAELIPFASNFAQKSKQTSAHNFVDAVEDALDEVRRRVKVALTCGCSKSESSSDDERKPGLLYDRQLHDIRRTFKPAVLFASMKYLACSPLSSSQNILGNAIARAQADAFRLLVSSQKDPEHGQTQVRGDFLLQNQSKGQALSDAGRPRKSKDNHKAEKAPRTKHGFAVQGLSQGFTDLSHSMGTNEKLASVAKVGKANQQSMSSIAEKGSTERRKGFRGEKGGVEGTNTKSKGSKPSEDGVRESRTLDATASHKIVASTDAFEERDLGESGGQKVALPERFDASVGLDEVVKNDLSSEVRNSITLNQVKATQAKLEKELGGPSKKKIAKVPKVDSPDLQVLSMKPNAVAMKVKGMETSMEQLSKTKLVKKAKILNVEMEQVDKTVKDVDGVVLETKRVANHDAVEGCEAFSVKAKKRKVSSPIVCNDDFDRSSKESVVFLSASEDKMQQRAEEIISDSTGLERDLMQQDVSMEITEDVSAAIFSSELDSEANRLHQGEALQLNPVASNDMSALVVAEPQLHNEGDQVEADQTAAPTFQAKSSGDAGKKRKKKPKDFSNSKVDASMPYVSGEWPLEQEEQVEAELKAMSPLLVKDSADITPKTKRKAKNKVSVQLLKPDADDALVSLAKRLKQGDSLAAEHSVESSLQAQTLMDISKKKKKKLKDPSSVKPHNNDGNTIFLAIGDGKENAKSIQTFSIVVEDQASEALLPSLLEANSRLVETDGIGSSFASSGAVKAMKDMKQKKKKLSDVKHFQKGESKSVKEVRKSEGLPFFNRITLPSKRVFEEKEHLYKDSRAKSKKVRVDILENPLKSCEGCQGDSGTEQHDDLNISKKDRAHVQAFHEGLLSDSLKPPGFREEEVHSATMKDSTNSMKAVLYQGPEDSITLVKVASSTAVPEASNRSGWQSPKTSEAAREQAETSSERGGSHATNVDGSKVEDVRTEKKEGLQEVLGEGRHSRQGNIAPPSKLLKKSVSFSKKVSSSSISLRPAIDIKIPVRGPKEVLNRFGQRVPRQVDEAERLGSHPSRTKNATVEKALMISFPQGFPLPSESELTEVFAKFGDLNLPLTRIDSRSGCARVIFRRTQDAEAALCCMKETSVYKNARFWLKPKDADVGELCERSSRYTERQSDLCHSKKLEAKIGSDTLESRDSLDKRVSMSIENDTAIDRQRQEEGNIPQKPALGKVGGASAKEAEVRDAQLSQSAGGSDEIVKFTSNSAGHESLEAAALSSSHLPTVAPRCLSMPAANIDISEPFLALLHKLHDFVLSTGFKF